MGQQNNLDITENFTDDIEATIDDLFAPVKEIEIDPLTNEVKEKGGAVSEAGPAQGQEADSAPAGESGKGSVQEDNVIDLGLELEDVEFEADAGEDREEKALSDDSRLSTGTSEELFEKFKENIMSLEWEIEDSTIQSALDHAGKLTSSIDDSSARSLLDTMILILQHMLKTPDDMPSASAGLIKGVEALWAMLSGQKDRAGVEAVQEELKHLVSGAGAEGEDRAEEASEPMIEMEIQGEDTEEEITAAVDEPVLDDGIEIELEFEAEEDKSQGEATIAKQEEASEVQEVDHEDIQLDIEERDSMESIAADHEEAEDGGADAEGVEIELEEVTEDQANAELEASPAQDMPKSDVAPAVGGVEAESVVGTDATEYQDAMELKQRHYALVRAVEQHLKELHRITVKIRPVEKVLAGTKGMDKLHVFQKAVRTALESQSKQLIAALGGEAPTSEPASSAAETLSAKRDGSAQDHVSRCPWDKLVLIDYGTGKIAVPQEFISFAGPLSGRFKKKVKSEDVFHVAWLRPWPWVKIRPSVSGFLADKDEKELKSMQLPVLNSKVSQAAGLEDFTSDMKKPSAVIIYGAEGRGGVIYVDGKPVISQPMSPEEWTESSEDSNLAGTAIIGEHTVPVIVP